MSYIISAFRLVAAPVSLFLILFIAQAASVGAQVVITSGTVSGYYDQGCHGCLNSASSIQIQGENVSISGTGLYGSCGGEPVLVFTPTCDISFPQSDFFSPLQLVYNGATYIGAFPSTVVQITMNFSGPSISVPGGYQGDPNLPFTEKGEVENVPFSMTGTVTVYSGSTSGPVILSVPISGSGIFSASESYYNYGGGIDGSTTYQFRPSTTAFGLDGTTQGTWNGTYGTSGYLIANGPTSLPYYATVSVSGETPYTWAAQTSDPRALKLPGSSNGIASAYTTPYPNNSFKINVHFFDGETHQVALYALDWDSAGRSETVTITDANTGALLDSEVLSNFEEGQYATWDLSGNIVITVTPTAGETPVISGIFFDPGTVPTTPSPSFTLGATAASIAAGSSGLSTVTVNPLNGFSSAVGLLASGWPAGITGTFTPASTAATSGLTIATSSVTINVGSSVASGVYALTVAGASGSLRNNTTIALTVPAATAPNFTLSATAASIAAGSSGLATVTVNPANGFTSAVGLVASGWPAGITGTFTPGSTATSSSVAISVGSSVASGMYNLTVAGTSGSLNATTTISLTVTAAAAPSFTISAGPATITAGASGSSTVKASWTGSALPIGLTPSGWPAGITATTNAITPPATTAGVTINVAAGVTPGSYSLSLIGTSSGGSSVTTIALTVLGGSTSASSAATYTGPDTATHGTWNAKYGADGFLIANDAASSLPSYATVAFTGASTYTWTPMTTDGRALQSGKGFSSGIASTYYGNTFNVNINLTDGNTHQVAVYLLDWDTTTRTESIVITDAASGVVLDQESFSGFNLGEWAVWNIKGNVTLKVTTTNSGNNAVVSGIFFGPPSGTSAPSPSFTLSASAASIAAGSSGKSTVTVNPLNGFSAAVGLSTSAWPSGITGSFTPTSTATSSTVAISVGAGVMPGVYSLTVSGTSGSESVLTTIALTVTGGSNQGSSPIYAGLDTMTQGAWTGKYGSMGYLIANVATSSAYATVTGASTFTWAGQTSDPRALQSSPGASTRIASAYTQYPNTGFSFDVGIQDSKTHKVSLYLLDWDSTSRTETVTILDAATNTVLDTETFSGFHNGQYASWNVTGNVIIKVTPGTGVSPVVSGVFID